MTVTISHRAPPTDSRGLFLWLVFCALVPASSGAGDPPHLDRDRAVNQQAESELAARLVEQLGEARFDTRERAMRRLVALGSAALPVLQRASLSSDRETRARARRALQVVFRRDLHRRREAFLKASDSERDFGLVGWQRFRILVGDTAGSRSLFVEMHRHERELIQAVQQGPPAANPALARRYQQLAHWKQVRGFQQQQARLPLGTVVALLFAVTDHRVQLRDLERELPNYLFQQQQAPGISEYRDVIRRLLGHWVQGLAIDSVYPALYLSLYYAVPEGLVPAEKVLMQTKVSDVPRQAGVEGPHRYRLMFAIFVAARFGDRNHLDLLEPLLDNASGTPYGKVEIRDLALAALLHLSGQDLVQFGFLRHRPNPVFVFEPNRLLFESPAARDKAIQRWRTHRAAAKDAPE